MAISTASRHRKQISMTSLIDVIFLLLLFFMLSSTFTRFAEIPLVWATAGRQGAAAETPPLFVRLSEDAVELNGQSFALETLVAAIDALDPPEGQSLLIAPRDGVVSQRLVDVLVVLSTRPDLSVVVLE
jgi:biopolymer transport protein ExbD